MHVLTCRKFLLGVGGSPPPKKKCQFEKCLKKMRKKEVEKYQNQEN